MGLPLTPHSPPLILVSSAHFYVQLIPIRQIPSYRFPPNYKALPNFLLYPPFIIINRQHQCGPISSSRTIMFWSLPLFQSKEESAHNEDSTPSSQSAAPTALLEHFHGPDVPVPPSARIGDPTLKQRESQPWGLWQLWKAGKFAAAKGTLNVYGTNIGALRIGFAAATSMTLDIIMHHVRGPPRKTWGIEMTLLSSIMRDVGQHSYLADIVSHLFKNITSS